jgi:hypothetical protein
MDPSHNPYAPSRASLAGGDVRNSTGVWRSENIVIVAREADLPERCVKCNDPADEPTRKRKVYWHHPGFYAVLLINAILYIIVAMIARKTASLHPGLCARHKQKRLLGICIGWGGFILGSSAMVMAWGSNHAGAGLLLLFATLGLIITGMIMSRIVYAKRIDERYVLLKGCGEAFLEGLPEFRPSFRDQY